MFEKAARLKLRFETPMGNLAVEDIWDLPMTSIRGPSLDSIAIGLHHQLKNDSVSFVDDTDQPDPVVQLRFDLVKHVIGVRKAENKASSEARAKAEQKQKILGIIARKEEGELEGKSLDDLRQMIGDL